MMKLRRILLLLGTLLLTLPVLAYYLEPRIIGGEEAVEGEVPWQVALFISDGETSRFCGGSIVSEDWVVSAAHCVTDGDEVITGAHEVISGVLKLSEAAAEHVVEVARIEVHPDYNEASTGLEHDIALLKLSEPLDLDGSKRAPIGWLTNDHEALEAPGTPVTVSGWGVTENEDEPDHLQVVELALIDCTDTGYENTATDNMICATNEDYSKDSCSGDSGGPLAMQTASGDWLLGGIVSFGPDPCAEDNFPGVYTRVSQYDAWLQQTMGLESDDPGNDDDDADPPSGDGSGGGGSGGGSALGSLSSLPGGLMLLVLGGLGLAARRRKSQQQHLKEHS